MKNRKNKYAAIPKPFISMTDMLVSLNAGLLVLGILSAMNPDDEKDWLRLQQETVRVEAEAASLHSRTRSLQRRHQTLVEQGQRPDTAPVKQKSAPRQSPTKTLASN